MQRAIWISFDLGIRGDYEGMYGWLDEHHAKECGDNFAYLRYEYEGDLLQSLSTDIATAVEMTSKTRIYVVWQDAETGATKGRFIVGRRKAPPWSGYARGTEEEELESDES